MKLVVAGILIPWIGLVLGLIIRRLLRGTKFKLRLADFLPVFNAVGVQLISLGHLKISMWEMLLVAIICLGIFLALFQALVDHELILKRYFRYLWRLVFILTTIWYVVFLILLIF